jgi:SAM-dependent methyltransferase
VNFFKISAFLKKKFGKDKFLENFNEDLLYFRSVKSNRFLINDNDLFPCLNDNTAYTPFDAHYVYHPAWAARVLKVINPSKHIDISSTLHFCSIISAFYKTEFYDYRPAKLNLSDLTSLEIDLNNLKFESNSVESISCMHTIEHIGLGRYGDKLDPDGDLKAIKELQRVTKIGGHLLIVVPVGKPRIQFNAHRIYSFEMINSLFENFELQNFSIVKDDQTFIEKATTSIVEEQRYGCGCFWYSKIK